MDLIRFTVGDTLKLKKKHPCSSDLFTVMRTGSDVKIRCDGCGREVTLPRLTLEKSVKKVIPKEEKDA